MLVLRGDGNVVTLLVLRRYGVYTVFDSRVRLFVSAGLKARVQRAVLPALESEFREQEELEERFKRGGAHRMARRLTSPI